MMSFKLPVASCQLSSRQARVVSRVPGRIRRTPHAISADLDTTPVTPEVLSTTDEEKVEAMIRRWKAFDADGNGTMDREELRHLLESTDDGSAVMFSEHWLPEDELDRVMAQYDKDQNGVIDFEEFKQIVYDGLLLDGKLSEYEEAFKAVDSSGNGTIGATELAEVFRTLGNPLSYEKLVDVMQRFDKDESGQIEFNEFLLMFRDQLFDLKEVQQYMVAGAADRSVSPLQSVLDHPEGNISLIFSEREFKELQAQCAAKGKLMILFCALTWCRPCKGMQRPSQRMAEVYRDTTTWVKLFGNANRQTKSLFKDTLKIRSTPCFIIYKDNQVVYTQCGTNKEKLEAAIRQLMEDLPSAEGKKMPRALYPGGAMAVQGEP